ncbi:MAG TPA: hypothetical protein VNA20_13280 [Frankiaceae bacterium]|nr:hypothetical protein [Frankiaceae bacterium]
MSVRTRVALLALFALAGTGTPAVAARPAALPTLAHQLYLSGSGSGYVRVRLTAPIPLDSARLTVMRNSNVAGFVGALLVREHAAADGIGVLQARPTGGGARQVPVAFGPIAEAVSIPGQAVLAPGTYRLYLLTRGTDPVHAIVFLTGAPGGVSGRRHFTVPANAPVAERFAPAVRAAQAGKSAPVAAEAGTHALQRRGLLVRAGWWSADVGEDTPSTLQHCTYADAAVPVCGGATNAGTGSATELRSTRSVAVAEVAGPATWTQQAALTVGGAPMDAGVALVWADLGAGFPAG